MPNEQQSEPIIDSVGRPIKEPIGFIRNGVTAVIFDESGRVLLEKREDNGNWGLPGGAVDIGESVEDAVVREVFEETALTVKVTRLVGVYSDPYDHNVSQYPDGNIVQWITTSFACSRISGKLKISDESTDIGYFHPDALPENTVISHRTRIADAIAYQVEPFVR